MLHIYKLMVENFTLCGDMQAKGVVGLVSGATELKLREGDKESFA